MLKFLSFDCDPIEQPAAIDPVERLTWSSVRLRIDHQVPSRLWDKSLQTERTNLYLPTFPIAEWLVANWWSLFGEICPSENLKTASWEWTQRHCLRAADSSLLLPAIYIYHDRQTLRAEWLKDSASSMPHMPGEFISDGTELLDENATRSSFSNFVNTTLDRVTGVKDERVRQLRDHWRAIQSATIDEQHFCILAGGMGLNPYDPQEMTTDVSQFLEQNFDDSDNPLVRDFIEVARVTKLKEQWSWVQTVGEELKLGPNPAKNALQLPLRGFSPSQFGYELARTVRAAAENQSSPLDSLTEPAEIVLGKRFRVEERNHVPGGILSIVGQSAGDIVTAGPKPLRDDSQRFRIARSIYQALVTIQQCQRLVNVAFSWDQKASRAFAAELLAPQKGLAERVTSGTADSEMIETLSKEYRTSTFVIEKQLENAGMVLLRE